ncbi:DUF2971 domain-containing protein [Herbaspirillum sp. BH-1]|uniref:DUF2971 domain-containing protein n=1 Tax=Herbaspirillum sp. (strain BH-1) TaxID=2058884 RepID=UPI0011AED3DC|nr:DUF2971 domain-containing protein [Herbaspirillum sp. BH-1]
MDFQKFKRFIEQRALYFCGARHFADPFEGEYAWGKKGHEQFMETQKKLNLRHGGGMPLDSFIAMNLKTLREIAEKTYINCWHHSNHESEAMWKLYCQDPTSGIAICTTMKKLDAQLRLQNLPNLELKSVKYLPNFWIKQYNPEASVFYSKRISFEYEKEFRAIFREDPYGPTSPCRGKPVTVNVAELVDSVTISPLASANLKTTVQELLNLATMPIPVRDSEIELHPVLSVEEQFLKKKGSFQTSTIRLLSRES